MFIGHIMHHRLVFGNHGIHCFLEFDVLLNNICSILKEEIIFRIFTRCVNFLKNCDSYILVSYKRFSYVKKCVIQFYERILVKLFRFAGTPKTKKTVKTMQNTNITKIWVETGMCCTTWHTSYTPAFVVRGGGLREQHFWWHACPIFMDNFLGFTHF